MAGSTVSLVASNATNAAFRAWGSAVNTALAALGLVQTSDTGQINWTTVTAPVATNTQTGYEIWRFNDSLQSTRPIFFRLDYGSHAQGSSSPQMWLTVGTASNGSGTITSHASWTGTVSAQTSLCIGTTAPSGTNYCYFGNGDGSAIAMLMWPSQGAWGGGVFAIERTRNADGTPNGDGFYYIRADSSSAAAVVWQQFVFTAGFTQQTSQAYLPTTVWAPAPNNTTQTIGTTLYPLPVFTGCTPKLQGPSQILVVVHKNDLSAHTQFTMTHYGTARTWVAAGAGGSSSTGGWGYWNTVGSNSTYPNSFCLRID